MNIKILKNGESKTYTQLFVPARYMRKALELRKDMNLNDLSMEDIDTSINFVVEVFGNQFTSDDIYDGVAYEELITTIFDGIFMAILQGRKQPKADEGNEKKEL